MVGITHRTILTIVPVLAESEYFNQACEAIDLLEYEGFEDFILI